MKIEALAWNAKLMAQCDSGNALCRLQSMSGNAFTAMGENLHGSPASEMPLSPCLLFFPNQNCWGSGFILNRPVVNMIR